MRVIEENNVNTALAAGIDYLLTYGVHEESRNGPVLVAPGPVTTVYTMPTRRVLLSATRDANPFFHLLGDALWCLSDSNDITWPLSFNRRYADYSDDGHTQHGAYGKRWRNHFISGDLRQVRNFGGLRIDQIASVVAELSEKPDSRQAVLTMWDPEVDLRRQGKDVPCNTQVYVDRRGGALNISVSCRSNDIMWGCYGANAVQFSVLQEYLAAKIGVPVGVYRQISNNYHLYTETFPEAKLRAIIDESDAASDLMDSRLIKPFPLVIDPAAFDRDLHAFLLGGMNAKYEEPFFKDVAVPMLHAWRLHKVKEYDAAIDVAVEDVKAADWSLACKEWLERRRAKLEGEKS